MANSSPNFLSDLVSRLDAAKDETALVEAKRAMLKIAADPNTSPREKLAAAGLIGRGLAVGAKYLPKARQWMGSVGKGMKNWSQAAKGTAPLNPPLPKVRPPMVPKAQVSPVSKPQVPSVSQPVAPKKFSKEWVATKTKQDQQYADQFWTTQAPKTPKGKQGLEQVMNKVIGEAVTKHGGKLSVFTGPGQKLKMSAYRLMAQQRGYRVGEFKFNARSGTAQAKILPPLVKQSGWWNDAKMMASYGASNPWDFTKSYASGLGQGLTNVGRGAKGLAETTAGAIGTAGTGIAAGGEAITDRMGITDPSFNTSWQAAKNMGEFTAGGAKNVGDVYGAGGHQALMGRTPDHVTQSHERMMDEGRMGDTAKMLTRGGLGAGRMAAEAIPYAVGPGMVGGAAKALTAGKGMSGVARAGVQAVKNPRVWTGGGLQVASDFTGNKPVNPAMQTPPTQAAGPPSAQPGATPSAGGPSQRAGGSSSPWFGPAAPGSAPAPGAPPTRPGGGFEVDGWKPRSGRDRLKLSADASSNSLREFLAKALKDDSSSNFLKGLVDRLRDVRDVSLVGAGGISAGGSADFLRKQMKYIKNYDPDIIKTKEGPNRAIKRIMKLVQEGDVILQGDTPGLTGERAPRADRLYGQGRYGAKMRMGTATPNNFLHGLFSAGMGGADEHGSVVVKPNNPKLLLRQIYTGEVIKNPEGRRLITPPVIEKFFQQLMGPQGGLNRKGIRHAWRAAMNRHNAADRLATPPTPATSGKPARPGKPAYGALTQEQLDRALQKSNTSTRSYLKGMMGDNWNNTYESGPTRFSILRPTTVYKDPDTKRVLKGAERTLAHRNRVNKYLRDVGGTTFGEIDTALAGMGRRFAPRWVSDLVEKIPGNLPGYRQRFRQGTQCAGGACAAVTGKGIYNLPSDLRHMKEFETVRDFIPETALKRFGATAKNIAPLKRSMRINSLKSSIPGLLMGLGLSGAGYTGLKSRRQSKSNSLQDFLSSRLA